MLGVAVHVMDEDCLISRIILFFLRVLIVLSVDGLISLSCFFYFLFCICLYDVLVIDRCV
jgi:hypothetical protein